MEKTVLQLIDSFGGAPFSLCKDERERIAETLEKLPTEKKAAQLFCVLGTIYKEEELKDLIHGIGIGGILFRPEKTATLQEKHRQLGEGDIPLLCAANLEEGGYGAVSDGTWFGSQMQVAATGDTECCRRFALVCAEEAQKVGVNWTFSPVSDIDMNFRNPITNVRTFGSDPVTVGEFATVYTETMQRCGIAACAKHFPGDGVDFRDQHLHATVNSLSAEEWENTYGRIYRQLIEHNILSIMAGHIRQPAMEMALNPGLSYADCLPGSLSKTLLTGLLREKYGFRGLITTDATIMGGFTVSMPRKEAIPTVVAAGCDMLVFSTDIREDYGFLLDGIRRNIVTQERLDCAVARILALKAKVCKKNKPITLPDKIKWTEECADKAITLVKDRAEALPISPEKTPYIRLIVLGSDDLEGKSLSAAAKTLLEQRGFRVSVYIREEDRMHGVGALSQTRLTLYLANEATASNRTTVRLSWNPIHALDAPRHPYEEPSVFVSLYNPYHLQDVPAVKTYINAYTPTYVNLQAVIAKLCGDSPFKGTSPCDAFCGLEDTKY